METLVLMYITTNPQAHFTIYTVYTVHWSQTQEQEMTHRYPNTFGDTYTYCTHPLLVKCMCLYLYRKETSTQHQNVCQTANALCD